MKITRSLAVASAAIAMSLGALAPATADVVGPGPGGGKPDQGEPSSTQIVRNRVMGDLKQGAHIADKWIADHPDGKVSFGKIRKAGYKPQKRNNVIMRVTEAGEYCLRGSAKGDGFRGKGAIWYDSILDDFVLGRTPSDQSTACGETWSSVTAQE